MVRDFAVLIVRNPWVAGGLAGIFAVLALRLPPLAIFSSALVALVALKDGWPRGGQAAMVAGLIVCVGWLAMAPLPGLAFPLVFALWPPLLAMAAVLRKSGAQGAALLIAGGVGLAFVLMMHAVTGDVVAFWHDWLNVAMAALPGDAAQQLEASGGLRLLNGFIALVYSLSLMLALLLGRWMQSIAFDPGRFAGEFRQLTLPRWLLPLAVALVWLGGLQDAALMTDLLMVGMLLYGFVGLAVMHGVIQVRGLAVRWLLPVYLLLAFFPPQGIATLALLGAVDTFVQFRVQQGRP